MPLRSDGQYRLDFDVTAAEGGNVRLFGLQPTPGPLIIPDGVTLRVSDGAEFIVGNFNETIQLDGELHVEAGSRGRFIGVFELDPVNVINGMVTVSPGGSLSFDWAQGYAITDGATVLIDNGNVNDESRGRELLFQRGSTLAGRGTLDFGRDGVIMQGLIRPQAGFEDGVGELIFVLSGLILEDSAELRIGIAGADAFDRILGTDLRLGGALSITLLDGFLPSAADVFEFIVGDITGTFAGLANGDRINLATGQGSFEIEYLADAVRLINFVPEPGTGVALGLFSLLLARRPRRALEVTFSSTRNRIHPD